MDLILHEFTEVEQQEIANILIDPKYQSFRKLLKQVEAICMQRVHRDAVAKDEKPILKGGVQVIQMLEQAILARYQAALKNQIDTQTQDQVLSSIGW